MHLPTPFQKKICWAALTTLAMVAIAAVVAGLIFLLTRTVGFLQPVLLPVAIAGILAYLLDPVVNVICRRGLSRAMGTLIVFVAFLLGAVGIGVWVGPPAYRQATELVRSFPETSKKAQALVADSTLYLQNLMQGGTSETVEGELEKAPDVLSTYAADAIKSGITFLQVKLPDIAVATGNFLARSMGGFLGVFGVLLSIVLVPLFLFYFLKDGPSIAAGWSDYLPLRHSPLKTEVVSLLSEINGYLISFFRGQMLVSLIDGTIIAVLLMVIGMDYAILIGLLVGVLGIIPYAGVLISWIPAVIIAAAQFGDWTHPLLVTVIFLLVNNLDSIFISPRIVGDSVGLHELTVIVSVLAWSVILGGLLGALLAVPLTATLKVVLRRYFWERKVEARKIPSSAPPG